MKTKKLKLEPIFHVGDSVLAWRIIPGVVLSTRRSDKQEVEYLVQMTFNVTGSLVSEWISEEEIFSNYI